MRKRYWGQYLWARGYFRATVGAVAEEEGHHPDVLLAWGKAEITIFTHKIDGLTESDFVLAAKIDRVY